MTPNEAVSKTAMPYSKDETSKSDPSPTPSQKAATAAAVGGGINSRIKQQIVQGRASVEAADRQDRARFKVDPITQRVFKYVPGEDKSEWVPAIGENKIDKAPSDMSTTSEPQSVENPEDTGPAKRNPAETNPEDTDAAETNPTETNPAGDTAGRLGVSTQVTTPESSGPPLDGQIKVVQLPNKNLKVITTITIDPKCAKDATIKTNGNAGGNFLGAVNELIGRINKGEAGSEIPLGTAGTGSQTTPGEDEDEESNDGNGKPDNGEPGDDEPGDDEPGDDEPDEGPSSSGQPFQGPKSEKPNNLKESEEGEPVAVTVEEKKKEDEDVDGPVVGPGPKKPTIPPSEEQTASEAQMDKNPTEGQQTAPEAPKGEKPLEGQQTTTEDQMKASEGQQASTEAQMDKTPTETRYTNGRSNRSKRRQRRKSINGRSEGEKPPAESTQTNPKKEKKHQRTLQKVNHQIKNKMKKMIQTHFQRRARKVFNMMLKSFQRKI